MLKRWLITFLYIDTPLLRGTWEIPGKGVGVQNLGNSRGGGIWGEFQRQRQYFAWEFQRGRTFWVNNVNIRPEHQISLSVCRQYTNLFILSALVNEFWTIILDLMSSQAHLSKVFLLISPFIISLQQLLFYCDIPAGPGCGGETVIVDVRDILVNLDKSVTKKFEELGIYYNYHWADESEGKYKSWQQVKNFIIMIV